MVACQLDFEMSQKTLATEIKVFKIVKYDFDSNFHFEVILKEFSASALKSNRRT